MRRIVVVGLLAGCTDNTITVRPIVDIPVNDTAQAIPLDSITMSVAHAGADVDIASQTFSRGDTVQIPDVPFGDDLVVHMIGRVGSAEVAYGRTCVFAVRPDARLPSPHLYFSRVVKFGEMSQQPLPRFGGSAMTYRDGAGLLIGGAYPDESNQDQPLTQIERFDPNSAAYDQLHEVERRLDAAVAIVGTGPDSRLVIVGGIDPMTGLGANYVEVIEAERNTDRQYEKFTSDLLARSGLSATTLSDGRAVVIGGLRPANPPTLPTATPSDQVAEISVDTGTTAVRELRATLKYARYAHTATRLTDELGAAVLVAGGLDAAGNPVKQAELYKPLAEGFSMQFTAEMIVPRWGHQAVRLPDGSVLIVGGLTIDPMDPARKPVPVDTIEVFSPLDASFITYAANGGKLDSTAGLIGMSATALPDGRVLLAGGQRTVDGPALNTAFIARLDPADGDIDVVATHSMAVPRTNHQATTLCDGTVLVSGGTPTQSPFERYNPPALGRR